MRKPSSSSLLHTWYSPVKADDPLQVPGARVGRKGMRVSLMSPVSGKPEKV